MEIVMKSSNRRKKRGEMSDVTSAFIMSIALWFSEVAFLILWGVVTFLIIKFFYKKDFVELKTIGLVSLFALIATIQFIYGFVIGLILFIAVIIILIILNQWKKRIIVLKKV